MRLPLTALFLLVFLFTACAAPTATAPAPTATAVEVTVTSQVTVTSTPPSTTTPEATATPKYPAIPQEIMDKLPANWEAVQTVGTWYIVDKSNNTNIYRFPEGKNWQERHDVTVGETTYEGWIKDSGQKDVLTGSVARMDKVTVDKLRNHDLNVLTIQPGYLTKYEIVEVSDGVEKVVLVNIDMKYFLQNNKILTISYLADLQIASRDNFNPKTALGKPFYIRLIMPTGNSYSEADIESGAEFNKLGNLGAEIRYHGDGTWISGNRLLSELQNPTNESLDLIFEVSVDLIFQ